MSPAVFQVSATSWEGFETEPVSTSPIGAVDEARKLMGSGDYRRVSIHDDEGQAVTVWTLRAGEWVPTPEELPHEP